MLVYHHQAKYHSGNDMWHMRFVMTWKSIIPSKLNVNNLSFDECRHFKQFYDILSQDILGPKGFRIFYKFLHHLLFYTACCLEEKKYPALSKCWDDLYPIFGNADFDNVAKVTVLLKNIDDRGKVNEVRKEFFGNSYPASTLYEISRLVDDELLVEIEAIAHLD